MKTNLRAQFALLSSFPSYLSVANSISRERAQEIAESFGDHLDFLSDEFAYSNEVGQSAMTRADTRGHGLGMFHNAERLFFSHVYGLHYVAACESREAARHED